MEQHEAYVPFKKRRLLVTRLYSLLVSCGEKLPMVQDVATIPVVCLVQLGTETICAAGAARILMPNGASTHPISELEVNGDSFCTATCSNVIEMLAFYSLSRTRRTVRHHCQEFILLFLPKTTEVPKILWKGIFLNPGPKTLKL